MEQDKPKGFVDYTGFQLGRVLVKGFSHWHVQPSGQRKSKWNCSCECGVSFVATGSNLKSGHTSSCGCVKREAILKHKQRVSSGEWEPDKLVDAKFGRLTVTGFNKWLPVGDTRVSVWDCLCDCGNTITMRRSYLQATEVPSCGCHKSEALRIAQTKHGMSKTPTYKSWTKMKERCYLESYSEKEYYQDHGIKVCDEWLKSFDSFYRDMGKRPEGYTLDRINSSKGYNKENCRWADLTIQAYNRGMGSNNTSGRIGVYLLPNGLWKALIAHYKEVIVLAYGVSFEDACKAREWGEINYYGWSKE